MLSNLHSPVRSLRHTLHAGLQPLNDGIYLAVFPKQYIIEKMPLSCSVENCSNNEQLQPNLNFQFFPSDRQ